VNERMLRKALLETPVPATREAEERAWDVVDAAYRRRVVTPARPLRPRLALAMAALLVLLAALALTPAGAKVRDWIRDAIEPGEGARPALTSLPAPGRLLVESPRGPWIVQEDGSKRLLGAYDEATWSPSGYYVAAARGRELVAVVADPEVARQPAGTIRWSVTQPRPINDPTWAPSGTELAYLAGTSLHVVEGDGSPDVMLDAHVLPTPPAWMPDPSRNGNTLAYVDADHTVRVVDVETGAQLWRSAPIGGPIPRIDWSADGRQLAVLSRVYFVVLGSDGESITKGPTGGTPEAAAFSPAGDTLALARHTIAGKSQMVLFNVRAGALDERQLLSKPGRFTDVAWSPDGDWLLVPWRDADTWLFVRPGDGHVTAYSGISSQFAPGSSAPAGFPRPAGWCCAAPP
jgi:WD40 repeat protein